MLLRLLILLHLLPVFVSAQENDTALLRSLSVAYENDLLAATFDTTTDYYYTGGTLIDLYLPCLAKNPLAKMLVHLPNGHDQSFGIAYGHLAYTPTSIESDSILTGDRPFSGIIYLGLSRTSCNTEKRLRLTSRFDAGIIGPLSFAYETQKFIHAHTNNPEPHGWQYQIGNDLYLNYCVKLEKGFVTGTAFELIGYTNANAGTAYLNAVAGVKLRAGRMQPYFDTPRFTDRFLCWGYTNAECKAIGRDATLQGGLINKHSVYFIPTASVNRAVFLLTVGAVAAYRKFRLEYFNTFLTPEFSTGKTHLWGHFSVQYFF